MMRRPPSPPAVQRRAGLQMRYVPMLAALAAMLLGAAPPRRIVSLNICADQLVIALADRTQVAALTDWSRDPALSAAAVRARTWPITHRSAEAVLALRPDLVIAPPARIQALLAPGTATLALPPADDLPGIKAAIRTVAAAVGHPDRGAAVIAAMHAALARIGPPPGRRRVAAYYQRQGYLTGTGTLVDDLFRRVGLVNLAGRLGRPVLSPLALEELAYARPDLLVMESDTRIVVDRGTALLHHPLLDRVVPPAHRLYLPQAFTVCGGPAYPRAVALLAAQLRALDRR